ncbi:MAG: acyl-CoA synthetase, partial [Lysobacterales bacterium]
MCCYPRFREVYVREQKVYRTELTPVSFLRRSSYMFPQKTAVVHGDRRCSYREFEERVNRLSSSLVKAGLKKEDRVAFLAPNIPSLLEAHFAVPAAGGVLVAINVRLNGNEVEYILKDSGARFLFIDETLFPAIASLDLSNLQV